MQPNTSGPVSAPSTAPSPRSVVGLFGWVKRALVGERQRKLTEDGHPIHWLSYLLICAQSAAVVLAIGHAEIPMLLSGDLLTMIEAGLALGLLIASVWAADICALRTLKRVPVLWRNRQTLALWEHALYLAFVLAIECSTYAIVIAALDRNPHSLLDSTPIIPVNSVLFIGQIVCRAILLVWTSVQLFVVSGRIAPLLSTLTSRSLETVGGKALTSLERIDLEGASIAALFRAYGAMAARPPRAAHWWNGWLVNMDEYRAKQEEHQMNAVVKALRELDGTGSPQHAMDEALDVLMRREMPWDDLVRRDDTSATTAERVIEAIPALAPAGTGGRHTGIASRLATFIATDGQQSPIVDMPPANPLTFRDTTQPS